MLAIAAGAGTLLGGTGAGAWVSLWLGLGVCAALGAALAPPRRFGKSVLDGDSSRRGHGCLRRGAVAVSVGALATAWSGAVWHRMADDDIARIATAIGEQPTLVRLRGIVEEAPRPQARRGALAAFDRRPPRWRFPLRVEAILRAHAEGDRVEPASGRVWISVAADAGAGSVTADAPLVGGATRHTSTPLMGLTGGAGIASRRESSHAPAVAAGDRIEALGSLSPFQPPRNPGEFDARRWARGEGLGGVLWVDSPGLLRPVDASEGSVSRWLFRVRGALAEFGATSLEQGLPAWLDAEHRALLRAMFLGRRDDALSELEAAFQRTGAIHLIAISGFNMAVLATTTLLLIRLRSPARRWHALAVAVTVSLYLLMVESQPAVLRAGAMILVFCAGEAMGRRWTMCGVVAVAAILLLMGSPARLENAGFQLSFAVVAALAWLAPVVRRRWFGKPDPGASSLVAVLRESLRTALAAALTAWLVSTPLTLHHFGMISPLGAPLSLVAIPLGSLLLAAGYAKMFVTVPFPWLGALLGVPVAALSEALASTIRMVDGLPGAVVHLPRPGGLWTCAALLTIGAWGWRRGQGRGSEQGSGRGPVPVSVPASVPVSVPVSVPGERRRRQNRRTSTAWSGRVIASCAVFLVLGLVWPLQPWQERPRLRLDALAVGDGTAILIRSEASAVLFDAGGGSGAVGERTIVPALRALGVRRLDAVVVSHANMDHYFGLPEVIAAFPVGQVAVNEATLAAFDGSADPASSPLATALARVVEHDVPIRVARRGDRMRLGAAEWTWLHPPAGWSSRGENDSSQVIRIEVDGASILLCGDIEEIAIEELVVAAARSGDPAMLRADVMELPHHGSWNPASVAFVQSVRPAFVVQSTGLTRWRRDRWGTALEGIDRLVTARDGACTVELDAHGRWNARRWRSGG